MGPVRSSEGGRSEEPRIAVCPSQRAAMVYALREAERDAMRASVAARALTIEGVDLVMWLERDAHEAPREASSQAAGHGELRFRARAARRGPARGLLEHRRRARGARRRGPGREAHQPAYPDALARVWAALTCPNSGEVLLSAAPG